jgi:transposase
MRPVCVFANGTSSEIERLRSGLRGPWRPTVRAVMVLLSVHGLPAAQIAGLLERHPATVGRWIGRFNREGTAGLADRPRSGRPRLGGRRLARRVAALLERPGPWTLPRIWRYLGRAQVSMRTLYRRVRQVAVWRRPKLTARGDPGHDQAVAAIVAGCWSCRGGRWCWPADRGRCCAACWGPGQSVLRCPDVMDEGVVRAGLSARAGSGE